ncbi:hypothetical protein K6025_03640 [Ehrlichia sp. JZT12]
MSLIFVFMHDGSPLLFPVRRVQYDKSRNVYYPKESVMKGFLAEDVHENPFFQRHPHYDLYGFQFDSFYCVTSTSLGTEMLICFGKNRKGVCGYMVCAVPVPQHRYILRYGVKLYERTVFSYGVVNPEDISTNEKTRDFVKGVYKLNKCRMKIVNEKDDPRPVIFDFIDNEGVYFHRAWEPMVLQDVKVSQDKVYYIMGLKE